ncbi:helix-turn-helix transcriptional regulator [Azospirillum sp. SYSU D00513]|uniref:helix-turn-helix domain-containing protein n=1 Tax=Azospirillum sp. SYSU D00513 TaxID=2812561 RepID=UPI001A95AD6E|nr:helix-turn-helix transcriptional regulator [Azospirillum sp. SYSU D00513]
MALGRPANPIGDGPDAVDVYVGSRIRIRRTLMALSQTTLAKSVGLTFQQIQKYERGANRVSASMLWQFSQALDVPISYFFEDMPSDLGERGGLVPEPVDAKSARNPAPALLRKRETLELMKAYTRISNPRDRQRMYEIFKALGDLEGPAAQTDTAEPE